MSVANELVSVVSLVPLTFLLSLPPSLALAGVGPTALPTGLHYTQLTVVNCARTYVSMAPR